MIKIGLDLHGVINEIPDFFSQLSKVLVDAGHEVHIITGNTINEALKTELTNLNISYTNLFSLLDYHQSIGTPIVYDAEGKFFIDEYLWDKTKADYCLKHSIQLHIDDSDRYGYFFKTPYARFYSKDKRKHFIRKE